MLSELFATFISLPAPFNLKPLPLRQNSLGSEPIPHGCHWHRNGLNGHHQIIHTSAKHEVVESKAAGGLQGEGSGIDRR